MTGEMCATMVDMWAAEPEARLTAHRAVLRLEEASTAEATALSPDEPCHAELQPTAPPIEMTPLLAVASNDDAAIA